MTMDPNNNNLMGNYQQQYTNMKAYDEQAQYMQVVMGENDNCAAQNNLMMPRQVMTPILSPVPMALSYAIPTQIMPTNTVNQVKTPLILLNGRKVLNPPENWVGPPPSGKCELYIRRVPKDLNEQKLLALFSRFGPIYELRLPLDYQNQSRGYGYIKYTNEEDSDAAMEVMQHYFITPGVKFEIQHSYEKSRLYLTNVPTHLSEQEIEHKMRQVFPALQGIYFQDAVGMAYCSAASNSDESDEYASVNNSLLNHQEAKRGNLIIQFASHTQALEAKKNTNPGIIRLWGCDLKVLWANTEREADLSNSNKTLYMRNIDLTINPRDVTEFLTKHVPRSQILKVVRVRQSAFVDFTTRESAEYILQKLQGYIIKNRRLEIEWAKPCDQ